MDDGTGACARIEVEILEATIRNDSIRVRLSPAFVAAGPLIVTVSDDGMNPHEIHDGTKAGGEHDDFTFGAGTIPKGKYSVVRAVWTVSGLAVDEEKPLTPAFKALDEYRHSRYNTPDEQGCDGMPAAAYITDHIQCAFTSDDLKSDFIVQAALNGSGRRDDVGRSYVQLESACFKLAKTIPDDALRQGEDPGLPENADKKRSFRGDATVTGACDRNKGALSDTTVAANRSNPDLRCGDSVLIVRGGQEGSIVKTVTIELLESR